MKKILNKKIVSLFLGILLVVTTSIGVVYALNTWDTGYRINNGTTDSRVYYAGTSNSKLVTNNSGFNLFVPTKTTAEMNSFCDNGPSATSCFGCTHNSTWGDAHRGAGPRDDDTGANDVGYTLAECLNWCKDNLSQDKDTGQHICIRRSNGRCHIYRDDVVNYQALEAGRSYMVMTCTD